MVEEVDAVLLCARALVLVVGGALLGWPLPAAADEGPWGWPLAGERTVSRAFAPPASAYGAGHRGVDLPAAAGVPVRASAVGRVTYAGLLAGRGVVVVTHGSLRTTYEPVTAAVRVGQVVALGEVVGQLEPGHLGCATGACLHWGLRRGDEYLDPVRLVERGPVRLLPLEGPGVRSDVPGAPAETTPLINAGVRRFPPSPQAGKGGVDQAMETVDPPMETVDEPSWSLRAAEAPLGAAAVAALVVGIGLLTRPRPGPPDPVSGGTAAPGPLPAVPDPSVGPDAAVHDLDEARLRRSAAS